MPPDLQPVLGDWQERVKLAKRQKRGEGAAAAAAAASAQQHASPAAAEAAEPEPAAADGGRPDLDALSEGLEPGWRAMWDKTHKRVYWGNLETQASWGPGGALTPGACAPAAAGRCFRRPTTKPSSPWHEAPRQHPRSCIFLLRAAKLSCSSAPCMPAVCPPRQSHGCQAVPEASACSHSLWLRHPSCRWGGR